MHQVKSQDKKVLRHDSQRSVHIGQDRHDRLPSGKLLQVHAQDKAFDPADLPISEGSVVRKTLSPRGLFQRYCHAAGIGWNKSTESTKAAAA